MKRHEDQLYWSDTWIELASAIQDEWLADSDTSKKSRPRIAAFVFGAGVSTLKVSTLISAMNSAATGVLEPSDEVLKAICAAFAKHMENGSAPTLEQIKSLPKADLKAVFSPRTELYLAPGHREFMLGDDVASIDAFVPQGYALEALLEWMVEPFRSQDGCYAFGPEALIVATHTQGSQELRIEPIMPYPVTLNVKGQTLVFERINVRAAASWKVTTSDALMTGLVVMQSPLFKLNNAKLGDIVTIELRVERDAQRLKVISAEPVTNNEANGDTINKRRQEIMGAVFRKSQREQGAKPRADIGPPHVTLARVTATVRERPVGGA